MPGSKNVRSSILWGDGGEHFQSETNYWTVYDFCLLGTNSQLAVWNYTAFDQYQVAYTKINKC